MKTKVILINLFITFVTICATGQGMFFINHKTERIAGELVTLPLTEPGMFLLCNASAPTRLYSPDGPLAGPGIWGQMLAGADPNSLSPVGPALQYDPEGIICGAAGLTVPGVPCLETAYIQMVAWDGRLWGTSLEGIPADQLGRTDIVPHILTCFPLPVGGPRFTQPAIVPVPEPSVWAMGILAGSLVFVSRFRNPK